MYIINEPTDTDIMAKNKKQSGGIRIGYAKQILQIQWIMYIFKYNKGVYEICSYYLNFLKGPGAKF